MIFDTLLVPSAPLAFFLFIPVEQTNKQQSSQMYIDDLSTLLLNWALQRVEEHLVEACLAADGAPSTPSWQRDWVGPRAEAFRVEMRRPMEEPSVAFLDVVERCPD